MRRNWGKRSGLRAAAAMLAIWVGLQPVQVTAEAAAGESDGSRLLEALHVLSQEHVSGTGSKALSDAAIKGMVESLHDPYTVYMTEDEYAQFENELEQRYVGIGIRFEEAEDGIVVAETYAGSPAQEAGMLAGDKIVAADGVPFGDGGAAAFVNRVLGKENTTVRLTYVRGSERRDVTVERRTIERPIVEARKFDEAGIGYIRLNSFAEEAAQLVADKLSALGPLKGLLLDLRDNPGGLLNSAAGIAKQFVRSGTLIHTSDRSGNDDPVVLDGGRQADYPVFVLVNENSASASELLTGALQDYKAATVIGTQTFGKGSVQTVYPLQAGGVLKVTIEHYFTPDRRPVDKVGITPDVRVDGAVPQLIAGLRGAGLDKLELVRAYGSVTINGVTFSDSFSIKLRDGRLFVPSRVIAGVIGAQVNWDQPSQSVEISLDSVQARYAALSNDAVLENGTSYLDIGLVQQSFPQLQWTMREGVLTMRAPAGGSN